MIDWLAAPNTSLGLSPIVPRATTTTCCWVYVWNPSALTVTVYSPGWSGESTKNPASVVLRLVSTPVSTFEAITAAPATTDPEGSVTVP